MPIKRSIDKGEVTSTLYVEAQSYIFQLIVRNYYHDFQESEHFAKVEKYLKFGGFERSEMEIFLLTPLVSRVFVAYCKSIFCYDNLSYWLEAESYYFLPTEAQRIPAAKLIYDTYLDPKAPYSLSVDGGMRKKIKDNLEKAPQDLFVAYSKIALQQLKNDAWVKFKGEPAFQELCAVDLGSTKYKRKKRGASLNAIPIFVPLEHVITNEDYLRYFHAFCVESKCVENLIFWQAVQKYKNSPPSVDFKKEFARIFDTFLRQDADHFTSLPDVVMKQIESQKTNPTQDSFEAAERVVLKNIKEDSFKRFLSSTHYETLIAKHNLMK